MTDEPMYLISESELLTISEEVGFTDSHKRAMKNVRARGPVSAQQQAPKTSDPPKCQDCRFVKDCSLLYFPPCERMARADEAQARKEGYAEGAAAERGQVLKKMCEQCPVREEILTDDPRCAESCEGCLARMVCGESPRSQPPYCAPCHRTEPECGACTGPDPLDVLMHHAKEEYSVAELSDNEREMRIHLEYINRIAAFQKRGRS